MNLKVFKLSGDEGEDRFWWLTKGGHSADKSFALFLLVGDLRSRSLEKVDIISSPSHSADKAFAFYKWLQSVRDIYRGMSSKKVDVYLQKTALHWLIAIQSPSVIYSTWYGHTSQDHFGSMIDKFPAWNSKTHQTPRMWWRNLTCAWGSSHMDDRLWLIQFDHKWPSSNLVGH